MSKSAQEKYGQGKVIKSQDTEPLWTVDDVARYLQLNPETVRMMAREKRISAIKVGRVWRFKSDQIKKWLST